MRLFNLDTTAYVTTLEWLKLAFNCIGCSSVKILSMLRNTESMYMPGHEIQKGAYLQV